MKPLNLTEEQAMQIMASPEFVKKFNELTDGWKPSSKLSAIEGAIRIHYLRNTPFAQCKMDYDSYVRYGAYQICELEWGMIQKLCHYALNITPGELEKIYLNGMVEAQTKGFSYASEIQQFIHCLDEINTFVQEKQREAITYAAGILKARHELVRLK